MKTEKQILKEIKNLENLIPETERQEVRKHEAIVVLKWVLSE